MKAAATRRYCCCLPRLRGRRLPGRSAHQAAGSFARLGMPHERPSWWLVDEIFGFTTSLNEGALFGIGQGQGLVFSGLSLAAIAGIFYWLFVAGAAHDLLLTIALGAVTGGILGNLYDRLGLPGLNWQARRLSRAGRTGVRRARLAALQNRRPHRLADLQHRRQPAGLRRGAVDLARDANRAGAGTRGIAG